MIRYVFGGDTFSRFSILTGGRRGTDFKSQTKNVNNNDIM